MSFRSPQRPHSYVSLLHVLWALCGGQVRPLSCPQTSGSVGDGGEVSTHFERPGGREVTCPPLCGHLLPLPAWQLCALCLQDSVVLSSVAALAGQHRYLQWTVQTCSLQECHLPYHSTCPSVHLSVRCLSVPHPSIV